MRLSSLFSFIALTTVLVFKSRKSNGASSLDTTVATPLWAKCEGEAHTPKSGNLESSRTPEKSELELKGQNTSHWSVLSVIGKVLKCRCLNWPCIGHLDICSPSYGQKKGRESKPRQFRDSTLGVPGKRAIWM
jgi:hypothetical protein